MLALIGDPTNAVREGRSPSEADVARTLAELIRTAPRPRRGDDLRLSCRRASRAVADAARLAEREVVVVGRAMERVGAGRPRDRLSRRSCRISAAVESYGYLPPDKVVALCTGSQGEPRAALARIAEDEHPEVTLSQAATA